MKRQEAMEYARGWIEDWNRRDVEAVLAHFADDVVFSSPTALETVGAPTVRGKAALRAYWGAALRSIQALQFTLVRVAWDADTGELAMLYDRRVNDRRSRAVEVLKLDPAGRVIRGEVFYGVVP